MMNRDEIEVLGYNSRLDDLQAAVLRVKLPRVDGWNAQRAQVAKWYREGLSTIPHTWSAQVMAMNVASMIQSMNGCG